jgi:hypothetical protein
MKNSLLAAAMAASLVVPAHAQSPASPAPQTVVVESVEPVPVPEDSPPGSSSPGSMAAGVGAGVVIVVLGLVLLSSIAFFPSGS